MNEKKNKKFFSLLRANKNDAYKYVIFKDDVIYSPNNSIIKITRIDQNASFKDLGIDGNGLYEIGFQTDRLYKFNDPQETNLDLMINYAMIDNNIDSVETQCLLGADYCHLYEICAENKIRYPFFTFEKILKKLSDDTKISIGKINKSFAVVFTDIIAGFQIDILTFSLPAE